MDKCKAIFTSVQSPLAAMSYQVRAIPKQFFMLKHKVQTHRSWRSVRSVKRFNTYNHSFEKVINSHQTLSLNPSSNPSSKRKLVAQLCQSSKELNEVYRLRYTIFTQEYGAKIKSFRKFDKDQFDKHCQHFVVKDQQSQKIVGYTRLLTFSDTLSVGKFYTQTEFCLKAVEHRLKISAEIGRTCIHPDYRNGATIAVLWSKISEYLALKDIQYLFGCASLSLNDGGYNAEAVLDKLRNNGSMDNTLNVTPKSPLPLDKRHPALFSSTAQIPPLLKAYVRMGARLAPLPHWDKDFNVADVFIWLDLSCLKEKYFKHFMRTAA